MMTKAQSHFLPSSARIWFTRVGYGLLILLTGLDLFGVVFLTYMTALGASALATVGLSFLLGLSTLIIGAVWAVVLQCRTKSRRRLRLSLFYLFWLSLLAAMFAMPATYWPMRLTFALQRTRLEALTRRVERGDIPTEPVHLGFYTVTIAEVNNNGVVCLWICPGGHRCIGFGRCRASDVPNNFTNLNVHVALADRWQFIEED